MSDMNQRQPTKYMFLSYDKHTKNVTGLSMFVHARLLHWFCSTAHLQLVIQVKQKILQ